jgi:imidazolonepropionase-like amidohydrolase
MMARTLCGIVALALVAAILPGPAVAQQGSNVTVIQNGTILTVTKGTIQKGSILIRDGKIAEVGTNVKVPAGAKVIDATGMFVSPGIIDCHSHIAIEGSVNEGSIAVSSMVAVADVLDPDDIDIYRELAGGTTTSNVLHGSANPIGGLNQVIKHRWGRDAKGLMFEGAPPGIKFALGENPKRSNSPAQPGQFRRYPNTRMGVMDVIRQAFIDAREYKKTWNAYN